jgi:hypothetical protein
VQKINLWEMQQSCNYTFIQINGLRKKVKI